jgi:hypothetical protein
MVCSMEVSLGDFICTEEVGGERRQIEHLSGSSQAFPHQSDSD